MNHRMILLKMIVNKSIRTNFYRLHIKFRQSSHYKIKHMIRCCKNVIKNERLLIHEGNYVVNSFFPPLNTFAFQQIAMQVPGVGGEFFLNHTKGKRLAPISTYIGVTHKCMYHCWHCSGNTFMKNGHKDMTTEELLTVVRKLKNLGVGILGFTGGEPLLRQDLEQAITLATGIEKEHSLTHSKDMATMTLLFTTGNGLDLERAKSLKAAGLFGIAISLDSNESMSHDRMRGTKGAFETAVMAIKHSKEVGLYTMCQTVCTRALLMDGGIKKIALFAKSLGVDEMRIMEPIPCGKLNEHPEEVLTKEEQEQLISLHIEMNAEKAYPKVSVFPYIESESQYGCGAGSQHAYVNADGLFGPCDFLPIHFGNLIEEEASEIWSRMHREMGQPKSICYAKCSNCETKEPKYYRLLRGEQ